MKQAPLTLKRWRRVEYERLVDLGAFEHDPVELLGGQLIVAEPKAASTRRPWRTTRSGRRSGPDGRAREEPPGARRRVGASAGHRGGARLPAPTTNTLIPPARRWSSRSPTRALGSIVSPTAVGADSRGGAPARVPSVTGGFSWRRSECARCCLARRTPGSARSPSARQPGDPSPAGCRGARQRAPAAQAEAASASRAGS